MAKYAQSHAVAPDVNSAIQAGRNYKPPLDGIAEVLVNSLEDMRRDGEAAQQASAALIEDERRFVQMDKSRLFLTREHASSITPPDKRCAGYDIP